MSVATFIFQVNESLKIEFSTASRPATAAA